MKQRKQYIGKPPVHGVLTDIGSRIGALERAGLQLPTRVTRVYAPTPKFPPTPINPSAGPATPPVPVAPSTMLIHQTIDIIVGSFSLIPVQTFNFSFDDGLDSIACTYDIPTNNFTGLSSFSVWSLNLIGTDQSYGYEWWYSLSSPTISVQADYSFDTNSWTINRSRANIISDFADAGIPVLSADHGDFDLARTNSDGNPYDGRGIGAHHRYTSGFAVAVEDVTPLTESYIWPFEEKAYAPPTYLP